jgi:hypothetical protein
MHEITGLVPALVQNKGINGNRSIQQPLGNQFAEEHKFVISDLFLNSPAES